MFIRYCYSVCDVLGTLCAVLSPVAVVHWLLEAVGVKSLGFLAVLFAPLNWIINALHPMPTITFQGTHIPMTQGVTAIVLTVLFFLLAALSQYLKAAEQQMDMAQQNLKETYRQRQRERAEAQVRERLVSNRRLFVYISFPFDQDEALGEQFFGHFSNLNGRPIEATATVLVLEFSELDPAFRYAQDAMRTLLSYYATLRPADPQPVARLCIHVVGVDEANRTGLAMCTHLCRFTPVNTIVLSQDVKQFIEAGGTSAKYPLQSQGYYEFPGGSSQEVYQLLLKSASFG
ncbi:MAG: hypothetical protein SFZ03_07405 [Candidatus Melainabacteria bacterium]|nr:hypothetical protein [Candidatus Melainabacteria bacterium]